MYCGFSWVSYYNQSPDWVKALWVLSLPLFIASMSALALWFVLSVKRLRLEQMRLDRACPAGTCAGPPIGDPADGSVATGRTVEERAPGGEASSGHGLPD